MHIASVITPETVDAAVQDIILKELINSILLELRDTVDFRLDIALEEYQFTALQMLSCFCSDDWMNGYQHLHKLLNVYIAKITDYNGEEMEFGNIAWPPRGFAFEKLDAEMRERVKTMCHEYLFTSQLSADLGENEIRYVEYSLARFLQQGVIALDEPLVLLACLMWFNNQPKRCGTSLYQTLASRIRDHSPSTGQNGFEEFICFYLQHVFWEPHRLDEVFKFKGENKIGEKLATLVTLHINGYEEELRLIKGKINLVGRPSLFGPIGQIMNELWEEGTSSLQDWIDLKSYTVFCFPMKTMGPNIMCFLKLQDPVASSKDFTYICLAIQCKFYDDLPRKTLSEAITTVTPNNFFQRRRQSNASTAQAIATQTTTDGKRNKARDRFLKTLLNFPHKDLLAGTYGVLRIICGFPVLINLEKAFDVRVKDDKEEDTIKVKMVIKQTPDPDGTDGHPLASFNDSLLCSETRPFHPTNMLDVIIRRAYAAGDSLVLDQNSPGVIGISPPAVEPRRNKTGLQKAEAARKLAARHRRRGNIVHSSNLTVRKGRIVPQITEDVITMLRVDHAHWGERLNLKRKHDESVKR
ncbi:hypothetical protein EV368DRAFT_86177 [Lentinula lateritia]|nr:hypothetical protein EV368DRAFT_86177 [Lentinula lateritia]